MPNGNESSRDLKPREEEKGKTEGAALGCIIFIVRDPEDWMIAQLRTVAR